MRVRVEEEQQGPSSLFRRQAGLPRHCSSEEQASNSRVPTGGGEGEAGRTALGMRLCPLKQREDSVVQVAVPHKQNPCSKSIITAIDTV